MKYLILDDERKPDALGAMLAKKKIDAIVCVSSNDFLTAMNSPKFDAVLINVDSWGKGRAMYEYFGVGPKLARKPVVFYNVDEEATVAIKDRPSIEGDTVLRKPANIEEAVGVI